ncbi:glutathione S-transferase family protein [Pseudoalteromonas sp. SMS1]|uniref:glutathione S-transferase family protein n=1 Tax=Pseudoalteromonas sp. SMS1 TaxID=2908894 RepID=UPI001F2C5836|nr:glutathione S-transferase family protein [Pseudoalteromonas sp. SMS1]MCF2857701.1 glutathione S-transferase family protein [Pseudoalteromonas sp. SMS1]
MSGIKLYSFTLSGNSHKIRHFLSILGLEYESKLLDAHHNEHKSAAFLAINPLGQVPVLIDNGDVICDSNAILVYLAEKYDTHNQWYPVDAKSRAEVQKFLSMSAGEVLNGPNLYRGIKHIGKSGDLELTYDKTINFFAYLNAQLGEQAYLIGEVPTIADIALYTYPKLAVKAGINLSDFPYIAAWFARIESGEFFISEPEK